MYLQRCKKCSGSRDGQLATFICSYHRILRWIIAVVTIYLFIYLFLLKEREDNNMFSPMIQALHCCIQYCCNFNVISGDSLCGCISFLGFNFGPITHYLRYISSLVLFASLFKICQYAKICFKHESLLCKNSLSFHRLIESCGVGNRKRWSGFLQRLWLLWRRKICLHHKVGLSFLHR